MLICFYPKSTYHWTLIYCSFRVTKHSTTSADAVQRSNTKCLSSQVSFILNASIELCIRTWIFDFDYNNALNHILKWKLAILVIRFLKRIQVSSKLLEYKNRENYLFSVVHKPPLCTVLIYVKINNKQIFYLFRYLL